MGEVERQQVSLLNVAQGAASTLWQEGFNQVLENIADVNTPSETRRTVTLTFTVAAMSDERDSVSIQVGMSTKLAPVYKEGALLFIGRHRNQMVAYEHDPKQGMLFEDKTNLTSIEGRKAAAE